MELVLAGPWRSAPPVPPDDETITDERGCGSRVAGGIYLETPNEEDGLPLEWFLVDPPEEAEDYREMGITPRGTSMIERHGVWHVVDWVGYKHYPHVADFVEEVRALGLSRRIGKNAEFHKLTPDSKILLIHARASMRPADRERYYETWLDNHPDEEEPFACPKHRLTETWFDRWRSRLPEEGHAGFDPGTLRPGRAIMGVEEDKDCCAGLWYQDIDADEERNTVLEDPDAPRRVLRRLPCGRRYRAEQRPESWPMPAYVPAFFLALPITRLAVIRDPNNPVNEEKALAAVARSSLPLEVQDA
jgi:hypothetical protein